TFTAGSRIARDTYSVEMVFSIQNANGWRRIFDCNNRRLSEGLYLDPSGFLNYYSGASSVGNDRLAVGTYYHVVVVKRPREIYLYLNGALVASATGVTIGEIDPVYNANNILNFLLDDSESIEWAPARIALFRLYSGNLTAAQVREIWASPFTSTVGIPPPGFQSSGIVNSASYASTNAIAPGGFFSIFGTDLADAIGDWGQSFVNNSAPRRLNNVRVLVNDRESFVVFTSPGQINALAPDNLPDGPVTVVVENGNLRSAVVQSGSRIVSPAVFRYDAQNKRYLASTANDGSAYIAPANLFGTNGALNGLAVRPARPGEFIVLYATGLGPTNPPVPAGQIPVARTGGYPLTNTSEIRLTLNGQTSTVRPAYAGLSAFPGLIQVVFQVPELANGEYETVIVVAGQSSPSATFLPIAR
ncbi:MAG: hypothetical protein NTW74_14955, partial [Acidobacteria bacterium]|nr:hypothetical protein [Acidobacteriota bacterium]